MRPALVVCLISVLATTIGITVSILTVASAADSRSGHKFGRSDDINLLGAKIWDSTGPLRVGDPNSSVTMFGGRADPSIRSVTASFTYNPNDLNVLCDATAGAVTATLPAVAVAPVGRVVRLKKIDASGNACTLKGSGSETIDGSNTSAISSQWGKAGVISNGTAWFTL